MDFEQLVFVCWDDQKSQNGCTPRKALKARDSHQFLPSKCAVSTQDGLLLSTPFWNILNTYIVLYKSLTMDPSDASKYLEVETSWPIYGQLGTPQILWLMTPLAKHVPAKLLLPSSGLRFQMISGFQTWGNTIFQWFFWVSQMSHKWNSLFHISATSAIWKLPRAGLPTTLRIHCVGHQSLKLKPLNPETLRLLCL